MGIFNRLKYHLSSTKNGNTKAAEYESMEPLAPPFEADTIYSFGQVKLTLPPGHPLPHYRSEHPLYDRFLERLAEHLPARTLVIDVGANIGDTYLCMVARNQLIDFICIEPHKEFFAYLEKNSAQACIDFPTLNKPELIQAFVGAVPIVGSLVSAAGTAQVQEVAEADETPDYISLSDVLNRQNALDNRPQLVIKSDVDGFDFNVILSLGEWLTKQNLTLYFECQTNTGQQLESFKNCLEQLEQHGFKFDALDNFGNLLLKNVNATSVCQVLDYVWRQNSGISTRTIWYLDILATKPTSRAITHAALTQHLTP